MTRLAQQTAINLAAIRCQTPLIHNITNYVVMNNTANALLSLGASPVMAHAMEEVGEMVSFAGALVLNIGTLSGPWVEAMLAAGKMAGELGKPVILDPVGAGATRLRTDTARRILSEVPVTVLRGNASEILALRGVDSGARGVDSIHSVEDAAETALLLARELHTTLAITGAIDLVTDGKSVARISNGDPMMARVTGTGCTASAVIGAFAAVDEDPFSAAACALALLGAAGEMAREKAGAPGSFQTALLDALYLITPADIEARARISLDS